MVNGFESIFLRLTARKTPKRESAPLLIELFEKPADKEGWIFESYPFWYRVTNHGSVPYYEVACNLPSDSILTLRRVVSEVSLRLDPRQVNPLTFHRLVEVLTQHAGERLAAHGLKARLRELAELVAYEAIGLSRIMALAKDERVTELFVDSDSTPVYLDHAVAGRCESTIFLTERERNSLVTHVDTFSGYTLDFKTPSLKNDLVIAGAILRISIDLEPVSVNRFALDVRRLNVSSLSLERLISLDVISEDAAALLLGWLESGGNVTIVGETGTGKTTLLNALDERVEKRLRRLYIEDAVETRNMLDRGYHQMKVKVDPFDRGGGAGRTKESEIVKALHRSPDIVILSEIQSEEHSRAFFQALAAGARGIQTFHASTIEQAIRRWVSMHHVDELSLLDLGLMVQMARPDRLKQGRYVQRICSVGQDRGSPKLREVYMRDREFRLRNVAEPGSITPPEGASMEKFLLRVALALKTVKKDEGIES